MNWARVRTIAAVQRTTLSHCCFPVACGQAPFWQAKMDGKRDEAHGVDDLRPVRRSPCTDSWCQPSCSYTHAAAPACACLGFPADHARSFTLAGFIYYV